jgi:peptidoglycan LD-endopeptidase CwlK
LQEQLLLQGKILELSLKICDLRRKYLERKYRDSEDEKDQERWEKFHKGWENRINDVESKITGMAKNPEAVKPVEFKNDFEGDYIPLEEDEISPTINNSAAQDRDMSKLHPTFRGRIERWLNAAEQAGFDLFVTEGWRTEARQRYLYGQGRTRSGNIVTYTLNSNHRYGLAVDIAVRTKSGGIDWSASSYLSVYKAIPLEKYGLERLDFEMPHIQLADSDNFREGLERDKIIGSKPKG